MGQTIITNANRTLFYCWSYGRWKSLFNLRHCFEKGCRRMYEPEGLHLRRAEVRRAAMG
jgi:hypothetical protein